MHFVFLLLVYKSTLCSFALLLIKFGLSICPKLPSLLLFFLFSLVLFVFGFCNCQKVRVYDLRDVVIQKLIMTSGPCLIDRIGY